MVFSVVMYGCENSCDHVWMWELDHKEGWVLKKWCFQTVMLEMALQIPLDSKEIQPAHPKWNQSWIFIGRTDAEAEAPILAHLMWRADSLEKTLRERSKAGGEGDNRGQDSWMASPTQLTWVWTCQLKHGRWWRAESLDMLQSMGSQRVRHYWATEQQKATSIKSRAMACYCYTH